MKAITLSYDDGVEQDRRLVDILNRYGLKATFNLNSGIQSGASRFEKNGVTIRRMNIPELPRVYAGHEVASHSLTHPRLETLDPGTVRNELEQDKLNLERLFGAPVRGMAYPYGSYNDTVTETVRSLGFIFGRGVVSTGAFDLPGDLVTYQPTLHHGDSRLLPLAEEFLRLQPRTPQVFYLWGHSYEFDADDNWQVIEDFCRLVAGREDIFYGTNSEVFLRFSASAGRG